MSKNFLVILFLNLIFVTGCSFQNIYNTVRIDDEMINYDGAFGQAFVPKEPQRIVTDAYLGELLELNANVVGADIDDISVAWEGRLDGIENISEDIDKIKSLSPDLIIISNEELYEKCQEVAPTVLVPKGEYNPETTFLEIGKIVGEKSEATDWLINFNDVTNNYKQNVLNVENLAILDDDGGETILYGKNSGHGGYLIYNKLGMIGTKSAEKDYLNLENSYIRLDERNLNKYVDCSLVVLNSTGTPEGNSDALNEIINSDEMKLTRAYKTDHIVYFKSDVFLHTDPLSLDMQISELEKYYKENY